ADFAVGAIELRVVDVRLEHAGLEIVETDLVRGAAEELECSAVAFHPRRLVAFQHRPHEDAPAEREYHDERLHDAATTGHGVFPHTHPAEVHLGDLTRRWWRLAHRGVLGPHHADPLAHV